MDWYVIAITASRYKKIVEKIEALDIELYYPVRTVMRKLRRGRPREPRIYPLIPGYLFICADLKATSVRSISSIDGVMYWLGTGDEPEAIPLQDIERMRACERQGLHDETQQIMERMIVGERITLRGGMFDGQRVSITEVHTGHVIVNTQLLGQTVPIEIDIDNILD